MHGLTTQPDGLALPGYRYHSRGYREREWRSMWARVWLLAGRADEIPEAGDFMVEEFGPESVLMVRQEDLSIKAFFNVCQHRGNRLVQVHEGSVSGLRCPYHDWRYRLDGVLDWIPDAEDAPGGDPCGRMRLVEMPCEVFAGFIWVNFDQGCGRLKDYLGPIWERWSRYPIDRMRRYVAKTVSVDVNWKIIQDNFTESYHVQVLHPEAIPFLEVDYRAMSVELFDNGHTLASFPSFNPSRRMKGQDGPLITPWLASQLALWGLDAADFEGREFDTREAVQRQMRALGASMGYDYFDGLSDRELTDFHHFTVFPNFSGSISYNGFQYLRVRPHATDPEKCVLDHFWYGFAPEGRSTPMMTTDGEVACDAEVERVRYDHGEMSSGWQVDQDLSQALTQQAGIRSQAYTGARLMSQEGRLKHYADQLAAMVG